MVRQIGRNRSTHELLDPTPAMRSGSHDEGRSVNGSSEVGQGTIWPTSEVFQPPRDIAVSQDCRDFLGQTLTDGLDVTIHGVRVDGYRHHRPICVLLDDTAPLINVGEDNVGGLGRTGQ